MNQASNAQTFDIGLYDHQLITESIQIETDNSCQFLSSYTVFLGASWRAKGHGITDNSAQHQYRISSGDFDVFHLEQVEQNGA